MSQQLTFGYLSYIFPDPGATIPSTTQQTSAIASQVGSLLTACMLSGVYATPPTTQTGSTYTVGSTDFSIIANASGTLTLTLGTPTAGRILFVKTIAAHTVVSASSNIIPQDGSSATTAILAATAGKYAWLQYDGSNWQVLASN